MDIQFTIHHQPLLKYCSTEQIIRLVKEGKVDFECRDYSSRTLMHHAVKLARVVEIELFIEHGADVNAADNNGETPLLLAVKSRKADELVPLLLKHEANVFAKNWSGDNALHFLARTRMDNDPTDLARLLIEKGVSIEDRNRHQHQPIHVAAFKRKNQLVKIFLNYGANVNSRAEDGKFPLYIAAEGENPEVLETLLRRGADIDMRTDRGRTALHSACDYASFVDCAMQNVRILVSFDADLLVEDDRGNKPLDSIFRENATNSRFMPLFEVLAIKTASMQPAMRSTIERMLERYPTKWRCYRDCFECIERMKATRFIETCTFFDLLTKCECQIAELMRNLQFESKFAEFDLGVFPTYADDILAAFERAKNYYRSMLEQEDLINEAIYCTLPYIITRKVARYALDCEACEMKRIVHACRSGVRNSILLSPPSREKSTTFIP